MSFLIAELFERHDRTRFEIFGYCSTIDDQSDIRAKVLAAFDHTRHVRDLSDEAAAHLIHDDEIDILIDLNGLTQGARLQMLRWRPARCRPPILASSDRCRCRSSTICSAMISPSRLPWRPPINRKRSRSRRTIRPMTASVLPVRLPLLTQMGESYASRMAARLLEAIGATTGIATTSADYVALAVALATDVNAYSAYKAFFNEEGWASTVGNIGLLTCELEATLDPIAIRAGLDESAATVCL